MAANTRWAIVARPGTRTQIGLNQRPHGSVRRAVLGVSRAALVVALFGMMSCTAPKKVAPAPSGPIQQIHLLSVPMAVNLDNNPGPDGFALKVYASVRGHARPIPITSGQLDVLMYDGNVTEEEMANIKPLHTWTLQAAELKSTQVESSLGVSYQLTPVWGQHKPTQPKVTLLARYISAQGGALFSAPCSVSVLSK